MIKPPRKPGPSIFLPKQQKRTPMLSRLIFQEGLTLKSRASSAFCHAAMWATWSSNSSKNPLQRLRQFFVSVHLPPPSIQPRPPTSDPNLFLAIKRVQTHTVHEGPKRNPAPESFGAWLNPRPPPPDPPIRLLVAEAGRAGAELSKVLRRLRHHVAPEQHDHAARLRSPGPSLFEVTNYPPELLVGF